MTTFSALTTVMGEDHAKAIAMALEQLEPLPVGVGVFEIEAKMLRVDFKRGAVLFRSSEKCVHRKFKSWATVHNATGWMPDHMHERMTDGAKQSCRPNR